MNHSMIKKSAFVENHNFSLHIIATPFAKFRLLPVRKTNYRFEYSAPVKWQEFLTVMDNELGCEWHEWKTETEAMQWGLVQFESLTGQKMAQNCKFTQEGGASPQKSL